MSVEVDVYNSSKWPEYAKVDAELDVILKALGPRPGFGALPDIPTARKVFDELIANGVKSGEIPVPDATGVKKSTIKIPVGDGSEISALLYQPESPPVHGSPLVVLYHGGGFCIGTPIIEEPVAIEVVKEYGAVAVSVDYRKAPEHLFPVAITDSFDALKWAAANASSLGADPSKGFLVGGTSAGGSISAAMLHMARDENLSPPLTGAWLNIPHLIGQSAIPDKYKKEHTSREQNKNAPGLDQQAIDFFFDNYKSDDNDPRHSVLLWPGGHKDLPPQFIQCNGMDPLRDDALLYDRELQEAGVKSKLKLYPGVPHGFEGPAAQISLAKQFVKDRSEGLKWLMRV